MVPACFTATPSGARGFGSRLLPGAEGSRQGVNEACSLCGHNPLKVDGSGEESSQGARADARRGVSKIDQVEPPTTVSGTTRTWQEALRARGNPTFPNERFRRGVGSGEGRETFEINPGKIQRKWRRPDGPGEKSTSSWPWRDGEGGSPVQPVGRPVGSGEPSERVETHGKSDGLRGACQDGDPP